MKHENEIDITLWIWLMLAAMLLGSCTKTYICIVEKTTTGSPITSYNRTDLINQFIIYGQEKDRKQAESTIKIDSHWGVVTIINTKCE